MEIELPMTEKEEKRFWRQFQDWLDCGNVFCDSDLIELLRDMNRLAMGRVARGRKLEGAHGEVMQEVLKRLEESTR